MGTRNSKVVEEKSQVVVSVKSRSYEPLSVVLCKYEINELLDEELAGYEAALGKYGHYPLLARYIFSQVLQRYISLNIAALRDFVNRGVDLTSPSKDLEGLSPEGYLRRSQSSVHADILELATRYSLLFRPIN